MRISDGQFLDNSKTTLKSSLDSARKLIWVNQKTPIMLITDVEEEDIRFIVLQVSQISRRVYTSYDFQKEIEQVKKDTKVEIDRLHFDTALCSCAHDVVGHVNSTFSNRIKSLIKSEYCKII